MSADIKLFGFPTRKALVDYCHARHKAGQPKKAIARELGACDATVRALVKEYREPPKRFIRLVPSKEHHHDSKTL